MKLLPKNSWIILLALGLTFLALGIGINFSEWKSRRGTSASHWVLPLAALACMFMLLAMLVWKAKWDKLTEDRLVLGFLILFAVWFFIGLPLLVYPSERIENWWLARWTFALFAAIVGLIQATALLGYFAYRQYRDKKASIAATQQCAEAAAKSANVRIRYILFLRRHLWAISAVALFLIAFLLTHLITSSSEYDFDKNSVVLFGVGAPADAISTDPIVVSISRGDKPAIFRAGVHVDASVLGLEAEFHFRREIKKGELVIGIGGIADANQCRSVTQRANPLDQGVSKGDDLFSHL